MTFSLPDLPYAHDASGPYMSKETLEYHHDKHHLAYVNNGNNLLKGTEWEGKSLEEIVRGSFGKNPGLFNNAGQHLQPHAFLEMDEAEWRRQDSGRARKGARRSSARSTRPRRISSRPASTQFGSGWGWLAVKDGKIVVTKTANGESPLVHGGTPILGVDVWEHSYYIDYRNRRPDYLKAFVDNLVNWEYVAELYHAAVADRRRRATGAPIRRARGPAARAAASVDQIDLLVLAQLDALIVGHRAVLVMPCRSNRHALSWARCTVVFLPAASGPAIFLLSGVPEIAPTSWVSPTLRLLMTTTRWSPRPASLGFGFGFAPRRAAWRRRRAGRFGRRQRAGLGDGDAGGQQRAPAQRADRQRQFPFHVHAASSVRDAFPPRPETVATMTLTTS